MTGRTIVVVEDEETIADAVAARLRADGFRVETAGDGPAGVELCERMAPDLVVLDLMLPGFDGIEACRRIQAERPVPVLMLTARDTETDVLVGLGVGADDYVTKPFSVRELVARVHAVLRRVERAGSDAELLTAAGVEIDLPARRVSRGGRDVPLTHTEFELLRHLAEHPGVVFSRDRLLAEVWGYPDGTGRRTVDSHVAALRRKLGPDLIRTARGVGYALEAGT
jgi:DNA-binding response OmpR family regulator